MRKGWNRILIFGYYYFDEEEPELVRFVSGLCIAVGIFLILFGVYTWKFNPESWSRNPMTWLEQKDWPSYIYTGAFLVCGGIIFYWLGF